MAKLTSSSVLKSASGFKLPIFGLGTWQSREGDVEMALDVALEAGYRLIDTAFLYQNEDVIGKVLKKWFTSGKLKREDVFITTKLPHMANNPKYVKEYLEKSLKSLQLDYVDLYLIHSPMGLVHGEIKTFEDFLKLEMDMNVDLVALWKEMEKQVDAGLAKAIGVSKFSTEQLERILKNARIPPANHQIEMYLYNQCKDQQEFCKKKGITLTSFSTLGSPGAPGLYRSSFNQNPMTDPVVEKISKAHGKTPAQVLLRHMMQLDVAVIPKSANRDRIHQNLQIFDFHLSAAEMAELNALDKGEKGRLFDFARSKSHPEYPFPK